jgi:LmbE family N-acetylglucosaminyl deacetylase
MDLTDNPEILKETDLVPFSVSIPVGNRVLVLAPHPDDESLGCGGTIKLLSKMKKAVKVIFLTGGEKADPEIRDPERYVRLRKKEALRALRTLSISDHEFLDFPDRGLYQNRGKVKESLIRIIEDFGPDTVYCPSIIELHPDHRAVAGLLIEIHTRAPDVRCLFYEVTTPVRPNILIDITKAYRHKKRAINCYKSQLRIIDYLRLLTSLNAYRTFTLDRGVKYVEAFWEIRPDTVTEGKKTKKWLNYDTRLL